MGVRNPLKTTFCAMALVLYLIQWSGEAVLDSAQFDLVIATAVGLGVAYRFAGVGAFAKRYGLETARAVIVLILLVRLVATTHVESFLLLASPAYRAEVLPRIAHCRTSSRTRPFTEDSSM